MYVYECLNLVTNCCFQTSSSNVLNKLYGPQSEDEIISLIFAVRQSRPAECSKCIVVKEELSSNLISCEQELASKLVSLSKKPGKVSLITLPCIEWYMRWKPARCSGVVTE